MESALEVNPDLAVERRTATFDVSELINLIHTNVESKRTVERFFYEDPHYVNWLDLLELSQDDYYKKTLETAKYFDEKIAKTDLPDQVEGSTSNAQSPFVRFIAFPAETPLFGHDVAFTLSLQGQASKEQLKKWIPKIKSQKIIGCLAQTELGHGSNVQDLETIATFYEESDEFVLHSPTLTAMKCWAGGLGRTSNYAIVVAKLQIRNKNYGPHMFVVPLRNLKDGSLLPGIELGSMGPRMGINGLDNGFLKLSYCRIPRENMLMKYSKVLKDGTYVKPKIDRLGYGVMMLIRVMIVNICSVTISIGCTIAVRYNCVRRQGKIDKGNRGPEVKIIDYPTQQYKLFPQLALAYGLTFTFRKLKLLYFELWSEMSAENLNEMHALSSGLKSFSALWSSTGIESCRYSCGGMGYLQASYLPTLYSNNLAMCTAEGDGTVLQLQTARYLMKSAKIVADGGQPGKTVSYLNQNYLPKLERCCLSEYLKLFECTAANLIKSTANKLAAEISKGKSSEIAWQDNANDLTKCADWHCKCFIVKVIHEFILEEVVSDSLRAVMETLFELLAVYWIKENSGDIIMFGGYSTKDISAIQSRIPLLLKAIRPNAVALVDGFDFNDYELHSVIGCYDGRVYERIYDYWSRLAKKNERKQLDIAVKAHL